MGIFNQRQFVLDLDCTQVRYKKKQHLRKAVTDNGGIVSYILTKKTSFLVASNGAKTADSYKGRTALKQGVPIVGVGFIEKCVEEGRLLDQDDFLLVGTTANTQFGSGKITTTKTHQETKKPVKISFFNINKFKVWQWGSVNSPAYLEDNYEVAKSVLLEKKEIRSQERSFYQLELHVIPDDVFDGNSTEIHTDEVKHRFRVFIHRGDLHDMMNEDSGIREVMYCESSESAVELYSFLYNQRLNMKRSKRLASRWIGSPRYRQNQLAITGDCDGEMSTEVASLVESLWKEVVGELEDVLAVDMKTLSADKVTKAESILLQIKKALDSKETEESRSESSIEELSQEFYSQIPHKMQHKEDFKTKSVIAKKQDLCQLIKDIVSVSETTNWSKRSSVESKYRALRCHISCLPDNHPEYHDIKNLVLSTQGKKWPVKILNIFAVTRPLELTSYNAKLHNSQLLFHASRPANFVGILSRGLVLPKVVVDDFGGERTDAGMLGSGIYFADSFGTSAKYSHASHTKGTRLMAVNQVALGNCQDTTIYQKDLLKPPEGFHSVHGVKHNGTNHSDFKDDEFVVYNTNQQRLRYLIEFSLPDDKPATLPVCDNEDAKEVVEELDVDHIAEAVSDTIDLSDVQSVENPLTKIKPGLLSNTDQPIPLKAVHVRARLQDLAAQVVVLQVYANDSDTPIEAKYVFPLDEQAAVCGFEAFINDKHIVGEVKEKETAHREYKEAISQGHGAYLMDEEKPDVFTVSVGNLPPNTTVVIKITYVAELAVDGDKILFGLPGSVAPWRKDEALSQETQTDVETVKVKSDTKRTLSVHVAVEMPYDIRSLESPTHPIKKKQTATKATVCLSEKCSGLDDGFQLLIGLAEIHVPRMWAERHPTEKDSQACMLTFYPEFDANSSSQSEVVILLDLSNSMREGSHLQDAKKLVMLILHHLPKDCKFNIAVFGTDFEELFPQSKVMNKETMKTAQSFIQGLSATMGNTDVWRPLKAYFMLKSEQLRNVFFISDGHVSNDEATLEAVRKNCRHTRVFTFGVSATANKYLLRAVSNAGAGAFEYFDNKTKSKWEGKVKSQLSKASQPVLSSVSVKWCQFDDDAPTPIQAPNHITSLFSGSRQVVYGFVPYCTQATLTATIDGKEVSTMVSTHDLSITQGKILHQLTARNIIRDWEEGSLATDHTRHEARKAEQKTYIISLSKKYSIVTQFTSFVAVEVRDETESDKARSGVNVADLLQKEAVDSLTYLDWPHDHFQDAPEETETVAEYIEFYANIEFDDEEKAHICKADLDSDESTDYEEIFECVSVPSSIVSSEEADDDDSDVLSADMRNDKKGYELEVAVAISRSMEEESGSDEYMDLFCDDEVYDDVPVEAEQERARDRDRITPSVEGEINKDAHNMPMRAKQWIPIVKGLQTTAASQIMRRRELHDEEIVEERIMGIPCASKPMPEQQHQQLKEMVISAMLEENYLCMSSSQPEVTYDKQMKIEMKKKAYCSQSLGADLEGPQLTNEEKLAAGSQIRRRYQPEQKPDVVQSQHDQGEGSLVASPLKKKTTLEAEHQQQKQQQQQYLYSMGIPKRFSRLKKERNEQRKSHGFGGFGSEVGQLPADPVMQTHGHPEVAMRKSSPPPSPPTTASRFGVVKSHKMSHSLGSPPPPVLPARSSSFGGGEYETMGVSFGEPSPPRPMMGVSFGLSKKGGLFGRSASPKQKPSCGGLPPGAEEGLSAMQASTADSAYRGGRSPVRSGLSRRPPLPPPPPLGGSSVFGRGEPPIKAGLFGGPALPLALKQTGSSTFRDSSSSYGFGGDESWEKVQWYDGTPHPPPPTGSFGFGGVGSSEKAGLFSGPPPPPPPTGSLGFGEVSSSEKAGLFSGTTPPPPPTGSLGFGGVGSSEKAGLFSGPPPPPPPTGSLGFGEVSSSEKAGLFSGTTPPPPPTRSLGFGGVGSSEKTGLFSGTPPLPTRSLGFVGSSEKAGLFGGPPPPPPPTGSLGFGGVKSSEKTALFGGPPPLPPTGSIGFRKVMSTSLSPSYSPTSPGSTRSTKSMSFSRSDLLGLIKGRANLTESQELSSEAVPRSNSMGPLQVSMMRSSQAKSDKVPPRDSIMVKSSPILRARGISFTAAEKKIASRTNTKTSADERELLMPLGATLEDRHGDIKEDANIETNIRISNGKTNIAEVMVLLKQQNEVGWWSLGSAFESVVGVRSSYISKMLIDAGVKSLGADMARLLEQLVTTYLIILHLNKILKLSPTPRINSRDRETTVEAVLKAERWVAQVESTHPSMARHLELGSSWDEVCIKLFKGDRDVAQVSN